MNREPYVLPLQNKMMIDLRNLTLFERTIENKFDYECNFNYILQLNPQQINYANQYFLSLFNNNEITKQAFLDLIKSSLIGIPLRYIFFFLGSGSNGKSLLFELLSFGLSKVIDTISKDVVIKKKSNSHLNTEIEKLDKARLCYTSELKEDDLMNEPLIKQITGSDKLNLRTLNKTDYSIQPTCSICVITNKMPKIDVEPAISKRLIMFPMKNKFETNSKFKDELFANKDVIFSYILQYGNIRDELILSQEMMYSKDDIINDNKFDPLEDYFNEKLIKNTNSKIKRDDVISRYNIWCKEKDYKLNQTTPQKFSRMMKEKFGIEAIGSNGVQFYKGIAWNYNEVEYEN
jgi:P4 family phage/plasmid primase-like protien